MQEQQDGVGGVRPTDGDRLLDTAQGHHLNDGNAAQELVACRVGDGRCGSLRRLAAKDEIGN